jgi:O-methyltransferase
METSAPNITRRILRNSAREGIAFGKSRADCSPEQIDDLLGICEEVRNVPGIIAEVGSWKCGTAICMAADEPTREIYAFDLFGGLPYGESQSDFQNFGGTELDEILEAISGYPNICAVIGRHEETIPLFATRKKPIALLFMDSDFYSSHVVALTHFWPLISPGGIALFHDFTFDGVQQAIKEVIPKQEYEWARIGWMGALKKIAR